VPRMQSGAEKQRAFRVKLLFHAAVGSVSTACLALAAYAILR
jgi:hypothetical protein